MSVFRQFFDIQMAIFRRVSLLPGERLSTTVSLLNAPGTVSPQVVRCVVTLNPPTLGAAALTCHVPAWTQIGLIGQEGWLGLLGLLPYKNIRAHQRVELFDKS